jgi:predicted CoA-substrate-specific enzyme activase
MEVFLGIDIGSVSLKVVALDACSANVVHKSWRRTNGRPFDALRVEINDMVEKLGDCHVLSSVVTGSGQRLLLGLDGFYAKNEIICHARACWEFHPDVMSIIEIGGQDSKFIMIRRSKDKTPYVAEHGFNELCAAGTGAFLDQMAERLGVTIDEFSRMARDAKRAARMAGRCAVFAKTDLIHLQQRACPQEEIALGLCFALARNYLASVCKGRPVIPKVSLQGGVARNDGVMRAFKEILSLGDDDIIRPMHHMVMGALGAALFAKCAPQHETRLSEILGRIDKPRRLEEQETRLPRLFPSDASHRPVRVRTSMFKPDKKGFFLGLDVGSVTTKAVLIDADVQMVASAYVPTQGKPTQAIAQVLSHLASQVPEGMRVTRAITTGSGRHLAKHLIRADDAIDEITAQAKSATFFFEDAQTIFEIGGQDSKFIALKGGNIYRFQMNRACAAGTGAFLEEQGFRLGMNIEKDFSRLAFSCAHPVSMGSRCTVFMDSDLVHYIQKGASTEALCAGLAYAVAKNYLEKVVGSRPIGKRVVFQGGVAKNDAVRAAFSQLLNQDIMVHPYPEVSGALGAALIALEQYKNDAKKSTFIGLGAQIRDVDVATIECKACENMCEVQKVKVGSNPSDVAFFGSVCGRFERGVETPIEAEDLFSIRERLLLEWQKDIRKFPRTKGEVALPVALMMHDLLPFYGQFLSSLGFEVVLSPRTNKKIQELGSASVPAEFCQPMKVLFGHAHEMLERGFRRIFVPSVQKEASPGEKREWFLCPYTQAAPYVVGASFGERAGEVITFGFPTQQEEWIYVKEASKQFQVPLARAWTAFLLAKQAQQRFREACRKEGEKVLKRLERTGKIGCVIIGRPYNVYDRHMNLNLVRRLKGLGVEPVPMAFLPLEDEALPEFWRRVRWAHGRTLLKAARIVRRSRNLCAVVVTNFGCGPDAFIDQYLEEVLKETPHIVLEFDDHQAEAGLITRLEAFARVAREGASRREVQSVHQDDIALAPGTPRLPLRQYRYYVPMFSDHAHAIVGALRWARCEAVLLPPTDAESWELGLKHAYGRECHPYIALLGDFLKATKRADFDPQSACFYGASYMGPCLLPQYMMGMSLVMKRLGLDDVTFLNLTDPPTMKELGKGYIAKLVLGLLAIDRLYKWKVEIEPYEIVRGEVERVHQENMRMLEDAMAEGGFLGALDSAIQRMNSVPLREDCGNKPKVGVIGDIYTRINPYANSDLYKKLENMGFEVWSSAMMIDIAWLGSEQWHEELYRKGKFLDAMFALGMLPFTRLARWFVNRRFPNTIRTPEERHFKEVKKSCEKVCSYWIDRLISMNIARIEDFAQSGASGVLNVMCHNCMIGTVTASLLPSLQDGIDRTVLGTLIYEGLKSTHNDNRLQAFADQIKERSKTLPDGLNDKRAVVGIPTVPCSQCDSCNISKTASFLSDR